MTIYNMHGPTVSRFLAHLQLEKNENNFNNLWDCVDCGLPVLLVTVFTHMPNATMPASENIQ